MNLTDEQKEAVAEALAILGTLKSNELWVVPQKTIDGLESIIGYIPEKKKLDDKVYKVTPPGKEGTFSDTYMNN